jgi:hypothetical protein
MNKNERFTELAGIEPDIYDYEDLYGNVLQGEWFPDYTDAREVLKVMLKRKDYPDFINKVGFYDPPDYSVGLIETIVIGADLIIDTTGKLRDLAIEWMEVRP